MDTLICPFADFEIKTDGDTPGKFKGYGSTFGNVDLGGDVVVPGAFDKMLEIHGKAGTMPHMFFSHDSREPIGDWLAMDVDKKGLKLEGQLWLGAGIPKAEQAYRMLKSKTGKGLSIGYSHLSAPNYVNGKGGSKIRELTSLMVGEVSPTANPMNTKAGIVSVKDLSSLLDGKSSLSVRDAEDLLRDAGGFSREGAKQFIALLTKGYDEQRDAALKATGKAGLLDAINQFKKALQP